LEQSVGVANTLQGTVSFLTGGCTGVPPYYSEFHEAGLPAGTDWSIQVDSKLESSAGLADLWVYLYYGTQSWRAVNQTGYVAQPPSGIVSVEGAPVLVNLTFVPAYDVSFAESGLPAGTNWSVGFAGARLYSGGGASIVATAANGTYSFTVESVQDYIANISAGTVTVHGFPVTIQVLFALTPCPCHPPPFPNSFGIPIWEWAILVAVIAAIAVAVGVYFLRYRNGPDHRS